MTDSLLRLYHMLPPSLRSVAATLRGYRLRRWRYGGDSEQLVAEALERDRWPAERLARWEEERLAQVLHRAATRVPYYRAQWEARRRRGDTASPDLLENWPILSKDALRADPTAFVADDRDVRRLFPVNTSGTTGKPLRLWRGRQANRTYYAILEARYRRWNGVSWMEPWAILGGQLVVPPGVQRPPFWVWNAAMHQLYLSANHVSPRNVQAFVAALRDYEITHLVTYTSSAAELGRFCLEAGLHPRGLRVVIPNAEPVHPGQRAVLEQAFGAPVRETYGMVEIVAGASECAAGTLHLWPDLGRVEVLADDADTPVAVGTTGRLVCTGLVNTDMPLIRYSVGDRGGLLTPGAPCSCGRTLPAMGRIEGRTNDMLVAPDGRRVYWLNPVFYGLPIHEAQVIQEERDALRVRFVPGAGFGGADQRTIAERLEARMGPIRVAFERVEAIPRGNNGKFRAVVCLLSAPDRGAVA